MTKLKSECPICAETISVAQNIEASEIIQCPGCHNRIVVSSVNGDKVVLKEAPKIEEDWGQ
ncbi:hypothetical protein A2W14_01280 [Candidatus Gottesmanbacteria bacterium RBG_16_37_8]|uniref:Lysine biosynthesis protein LysW n=1 Tax=Candidatus Gottesmanbacteria bacterium RBG_16_37_8 TaxID=1798371 RepID=A0A1F5YRZ9_9BACT|nr:MAG: hypothetical protein A2W14_01280 [Candidatus Gottesmanbacteria bacterium RBG_16_37_8]